MEPFGASEITDHPDEVDLGESGWLRVIEVIHAVPDRFQNGGKRRDADASADQQHSLIIEEIFTGAPERPIDHDAGKDTVEWRGCRGADDFAACRFACLALFSLICKFASDSLGEGGSKVANDADMHGEVILFRSTRECERVPLEIGHFRAREEDILTGFSSRLLFLDVEFHNVGRVLYDFGDVGPVPRAYFAQDALSNPDNSANEPVTPKHANVVERAVRGPVGLDHAPHAMELPADEKDDEQMVAVPEFLKVGTATLFHGKEYDQEKTSGHDPACDAWSRGEVGQSECADLSRGSRLHHSQSGKIDHMGHDVDHTECSDGPSRRLVEINVFLEGDDVVKGGLAKERDEIAANREEDENDINVEYQRSGTGDSIGHTKHLTSTDSIVLELVVEEPEDDHQDVQEDPDGQKYMFTALVDHSVVPLISPSQRLARR